MLGTAEKGDGHANRSLGITTCLAGAVFLEDVEGDGYDKLDDFIRLRSTCPPVFITPTPKGDTTTRPDQPTSKMTEGIYDTAPGRRSGMKVTTVSRPVVQSDRIKCKSTRPMFLFSAPWCCFG